MSDASYTQIAPTRHDEPTLWVTPPAPGCAPAKRDGAAAQISAARHMWEEDVHTYRTCTSVKQALEKQIISLFEPMYLDILSDNMVGYANISARDMLDHLFEIHGNITAVDLEIDFEHMRRDWDPQQTVESMFKKIQDCAEYLEAGGTLIDHPQQINVGYAKNIYNGPLHERISWVKREIEPEKNLDTLNITFCRCSPPTQENARIICIHGWLPLCKRLRHSQ
jgi:hypothetical protein